MLRTGRCSLDDAQPHRPTSRPRFVVVRRAPSATTGGRPPMEIEALKLGCAGSAALDVSSSQLPPHDPGSWDCETAKRSVASRAGRDILHCTSITTHCNVLSSSADSPRSIAPAASSPSPGPSQDPGRFGIATPHIRWLTWRLSERLPVSAGGTPNKQSSHRAPLSGLSPGFDPLEGPANNLQVAACAQEMRQWVPLAGRTGPRAQIQWLWTGLSCPDFHAVDLIYWSVVICWSCRRLAFLRHPQ